MTDRRDGALGNGLPAPAGFRMPPEWAPHRRCWLIWPSREDAWVYAGSRSDYELVVDAYYALIRAIAPCEEVAVIGPVEERERVRQRSGFAVEWLDLPTDDAWARDVLPTFVRQADGSIAGVDWIFNGWGEAFAPWEKDAAIASRLLAQMGLPRLPSDLVCEGGAIHTDGGGTLLATEATLLHPKRNRAVGRTAVETELCRLLGGKRVVWIPEGLPGDDTGGHIDVIAAFAGEGRVLIAAPGERTSYWENGYKRACEALVAASIDTIPVPLPRAPGNSPPPWTYLNFYLANNAVILPRFDDPQDAAAADIIGSCFPDRDVITLDARAFYLGGGGIHCATQQEPLAD